MEFESDITNTIQEFIDKKCSIDGKVMEKCVLAVEAFQSISWKRNYRIISIIRKRTEYAVVILSAKKLVNRTLVEIKVVDAIPFNAKFKFFLDDSRFAMEDSLPAVITGEDFTLGDLDPLSIPVNENLDYRNQSISGHKKIILDFQEDDFKKFDKQISAIKEFGKQQESFSSFDWLSKLKDESESLSEDATTTTEQTNNQSDNDLDDDNEPDDNNNKTQSASHSPKDKDSFSKDLLSSSLVPSPNSNSLKLVNSSTQLSNMKISNDSYTKHSMNNLTKVQLVKRTNERIHKDNKNFSTPDILDSLDDNKNRLSFYRTMNGDTQNAYIESKMKKREEDYCKWEDHYMFVGSWNVNGMKLNEPIDLSKWLNPLEGHPLPSLYVLGFQELDLSMSSVALNRGTVNILEEKWLKSIETTLEPLNKRYRKIERVRLSGILLVVYADAKLFKYISFDDVVVQKVATGMFGVMGNKGGVGIRLQIFNTRMVFINCHLAHGENNRLRRDQDFKDIERQMKFTEDTGAITSFYDDNDLVFLMGDLNYRLVNIDASLARDYATNNRVDVLREHDEFTYSSDKVFNRFHEGKIGFLPTYKFEIDTNDYDTSEKNRVPSYCDRILWYGERCCQLKYDANFTFKTSDHKPIYSWFKIGLKKVDSTRRLKVQESIIRSVDLLYNLSLPQAKVDRQEIHFESVHFYEHRQASINVTNTGQYEFIYRFKEIPGCPRIPDWLTVQPCEGRIDPDKQAELIFEIFINANNVTQLNTQAEVQCILVLDLQGGKDYFITITAQLIPTSYGLPLSLLTTLKEPVATLSRAELYKLCKTYTQRPSIPATNVGLSAVFTTSKEIHVMLDYLMAHLKEEELFARPGSHSEIQSIRQQLDTKGAKADFSQFSVHSVTEALLMFLNSLYFPIIPNELIKECQGVNNNFDESVKVVSKLPLDHQNLFHYLTSFLRKVLENRASNGTDINSLALLFVDLIFRPCNLDSGSRESCSHFISQFLQNDPVKYFRKMTSSALASSSASVVSATLSQSNLMDNLIDISSNQQQ